MNNSDVRIGPFYSLKWAIKKIVSRDALYVFRRIRYPLKRHIEDMLFPLGRKNANRVFKDSVACDPSDLRDHFISRKLPRFHFLPDEVQEIARWIPEKNRRESIEKARAIAANRFALKGKEELVIDPIDWDYSPDAGGWRWELNRQFFYTSLGFAYWHTHDIQFVNKFIEYETSWIHRYLHRIGKISWDHPFEVAARINAWIWAYFLFLPCPEWTAEKQKEFLCALGVLTDYLHRVIEFHNPGNHILLEAKTLALCAGLFPEFRRSDRWAKKAWKILKRELKKQICSDGVHVERSTMYHLIVAGELAELALFCRRNGRSNQDLDEQVHRMAEFASHLTGGLNALPLFGDSYLEDSYYRLWAPSISDALQDNFRKQKLPSGLHIEQTLWAIGLKDPALSLPVDGNDLGVSSKAFREGGYFFSRWNTKKKSVLIWDCGPIGYQANPYHAHLDALSFVLALDGNPIFIDPGFDEREMRWSRYLRGTAAHNTLVVDGQDQAILAPFKRRFEIWHKPKPHLEKWVSTEYCDIMIGSHDGFLRLKDPILHQRVIISMKDRYWLVHDRISGGGHHKVEQRFHLAPGTDIAYGNYGKTWILSKDHRTVNLFVAEMNNQGRPSSSAGIDQAYAELCPNNFRETKILVVKREDSAPFEMTVLIAPQESGIKSVALSIPAAEEKKLGCNVEVIASDFHDNIEMRYGLIAAGTKKRGCNLNTSVSITRLVNGHVFVLSDKPQ